MLYIRKKSTGLLNRISLLAVTALMALPVQAADIPFPGADDTSTTKSEAQKERTTKILIGPRPGHVGYYLAGRHAQVIEDWHAAHHYLDIAARKDPLNNELKRRAMVMAMGAGDLKTATEYGQDLLKTKPDDPLSNLFTASFYLKNGQNQQAIKTLQAMKDGGMKDFVLPFVTLWSAAKSGELNTDIQNATPLHGFHIALIGKMTGQKEAALTMLNKYKETASLKLGDAFYVLGDKESALKIYQSLRNETAPKAISMRLHALQKNAPPPFEMATTAKDGLALAFIDMAKILKGQDSVDSARIFAQIAIQLDSDAEDAHILLAQIYTDNQQPGPALAHYKLIPADSRYALDIQLKIAGLYESYGNTKIALNTLKTFKETTPDVDVIAGIGDLYRRSNNYDQAIKSYNQAIASFDAKVPDAYWYLYYVRGMAQERMGNWSDAEGDFKKALEYRPNDPFVLNYLAYGWAERGIHLNKSLEYLEKAVARQPLDGHIRDSLGWALYKLGRFEDAIAPLEKAITLLPYDPTVNEHLGDTYWQVGRKREAQFQWQRALNHIEDGNEAYADYGSRLRDKLVSGLESLSSDKVMAAENQVITE